MSNKRQVHVSPGVYTRETELTYAVKSLGITNLGVVGETLKGPAFEPIAISDWNDFKDVFGGTSTEKFKGSQYPKYELPYIAKSYLKESKQLSVVRVLGLSGYNAGPAWVVTAPVKVDNDGNLYPYSTQASRTIKEKDMPIVVLRARGEYKEYERVSLSTGGDDCDCPNYRYDSLIYRLGEMNPKSCGNGVKEYNGKVVALGEYNPIGTDGNECKGYHVTSEDGNFDVSLTNMGRFKIKCLTGRVSKDADASTASQQDPGYEEFAVTLNPMDKDYIMKVIGTNPSDADAPLFVESLYDVALQQMIEAGYITKLNQDLTVYIPYNVNDYCSHKEINGIVEKSEGGLKKSDVGKRFIADKAATDFTYHIYGLESKKPKFNQDGDYKISNMVVGHIYTVVQYTDTDGKRHYFYKAVDEADVTETDPESKALICDYLGEGHATLVRNGADGYYYRLSGDDIDYVSCDLNNYKSSYRYASTPWIVSNIKGDSQKLEIHKLFRFHTISDGKDANEDVKVSIQNVRPDEGTFDVIVRDINDNDTSIFAVERFTRCTLVPGDANYIGYKIGTIDGAYVSKSKYITVEVNEDTLTRNSVPCGFLGYPTPRYNGLPIVGQENEKILPPVLKYNLNYDADIKARKQYFGLSSWVGVDIDAFTFKGLNAYGEEARFLTDGFHLDCRADVGTYINNTSSASGVDIPVISVDGEDGYKFSAVALSNITAELDGMPVIGTEAEMSNCIYSDINLRKFTVYFYGGFDGWDEYRTSRTNGDSFKDSRYKGSIDNKSGEGYAFNVIANPEAIGLDGSGITSDYYAYLAGIRQYANPSSIDINIFATPGIDYVNNQSLVESAIEMIEEERADSIYVVTTPDKPFGASDDRSEMYYPEDVVDNLNNTNIDSNYTCTYYPWVKYEDTENNQYILLPPTKDIVRDIAQTDNESYPWFAPAGLQRGDVECVAPHFITKISDEDVLYENRINPIKYFSTEGAKVWGQKNLQINESQLNRINVRRLLLRVRKLISVACLHLVFDQNDPLIRDKFISIVKPILDNVKSQRGVSDYRIEVDDSVEARMERRLPAKLFIKPIQALEYIDLNFIITPEGVSFDDI